MANSSTWNGRSKALGKQKQNYKRTERKKGTTNNTTSKQEASSFSYTIVIDF